MTISRKHLLALAAMAVAAVGASAPAAVITWSNGTFTAAGFNSILPSADTVAYAENYGGPAATVGGIVFTAATDAAMSSGGAKSIYHYGNTANYNNTGRTAAGSSGSLATLLTSSLAEPGWWASSARENLTNLTPGTLYQVLLIFAHTDAPALTQARAGTDVGGLGVPVSGNNAATISNTGILGGYLRGTFVADATTQGFDVTVVKPPYSTRPVNNSLYNLDNFINAVIVSVPEPASLALLVLGGVALLARRRRG